MTAHGTSSHGSVPRGDNPVVRLVARARPDRGAGRRRCGSRRPSTATSRPRRATRPASHRTWLADARRRAPERGRAAWLLSEPERNALLRNTITPTVLDGSAKTNIIPQTPRPSSTSGSCPTRTPSPSGGSWSDVIGDPTITLESIGDMAPRYDAPLDTEMFHAIERVAGGCCPASRSPRPRAPAPATGPTRPPPASSATASIPGWSSWRRAVAGPRERRAAVAGEYGVRAAAVCGDADGDAGR